MTSRCYGEGIAGEVAASGACPRFVVISCLCRYLEEWSSQAAKQQAMGGDRQLSCGRSAGRQVRYLLCPIDQPDLTWRMCTPWL